MVGVVRKCYLRKHELRLVVIFISMGAPMDECILHIGSNDAYKRCTRLVEEKRSPLISNLYEKSKNNNLTHFEFIPIKKKLYLVFGVCCLKM